MEYGYWIVAGKRYINKLQAVVDAVPNGWWPHFDFHEERFSSHNWQIEPTESLEDLYCERARYLRNNYTHITIEFSGGADSWNALYSFLRQGLHVDAVLHKYVDAGLTNAGDCSSANQSSEGRFQAWPWFQRFQELDPNIAWHTQYLQDDIVKGWSQTPLTPFQINYVNGNQITKIPGLVVDYPKFIPQNKTSALIYGTDKPNLLFENNNFYLYFIDDGVIARAVMERNEIDIPFTDILFYWDPDCVKLLIKQAHIVMNWFRQHPDMLPLISNRHYRNTELYHEIVNALIYPEFEKIWQAKKAQGTNVQTHETWFHTKSHDNPAVVNWKKSLTDLSNIVQSTLTGTEFESFIQTETYDNKKYSRLANSFSKMYLLGSL
jgi:hypothetical protein